MTTTFVRNNWNPRRSRGAGAACRGLVARGGDGEGRHLAVALSGGSTPRQLYQHLAEPPYRDKFPWSRTHWFWGDERFVPPR